MLVEEAGLSLSRSDKSKHSQITGTKLRNKPDISLVWDKCTRL
jgi:hypothetical protein